MGLSRARRPPQPRRLDSPRKLTIRAASASARGRVVRWRSLPARNAAHIRQMVGDALVAVDAGLLAREQEALVRRRGARRLLGDVHRLCAVTVAALQRIIGLE